MGNRKVILALFALLVALLPPAIGHAIENCKVKIERRDGTLLVSAKNVGANPRWGFMPGHQTSPFFNEADCFKNGKLRKCVLGGPGTAERITPPDLCTLYVADDTSTDCAAYVKGCVPGQRKAAGAGGPVVEDSAGVTIGILLDATVNGATGLRQHESGATMRFTVSHSSLDWSAVGIVYFEGPNCAGRAFLDITREDDCEDCIMLPGAEINDTLYYASETLVEVENESFLMTTTEQECTLNADSLSFDPPEGCCLSDSSGGLWSLVETIEDLGDLSPPFTIRVGAD